MPSKGLNRLYFHPIERAQKQTDKKNSEATRTMKNPLQTIKQAGLKLCCLTLAMSALFVAASCKSRATEDQKATNGIIQAKRVVGNETFYTLCGITTSPEGKVTLNPQMIVLSVFRTDGSGYVIRSLGDETLVTIKPAGFPKTTNRGQGFLLTTEGYQRAFYGTIDPETGSFGQCSLAPLPREDDRVAMLRLSMVASDQCSSMVAQYEGGTKFPVFGQVVFNGHLKSLNDSATAMHTMARSRDSNPNGYRHLLGFQSELTTLGVK